jgi:hypothetical protein
MQADGAIAAINPATTTAIIGRHFGLGPEITPNPALLITGYADTQTYDTLQLSCSRAILRIN